jgi:hypothetical protein
MPANLSIGLNSSSLTPFTKPASVKTLNISYNDRIEKKQTLNNQLIVRITGHNRKSFKANWVSLSKSQRDTIIAYCNGTLPLWVRLEDDFAIVYNAFSYVLLDSETVTTNTNSFLYDLTINFEQLY